MSTRQTLITMLAACLTVASNGRAAVSTGNTEAKAGLYALRTATAADSTATADGTGKGDKGQTIFSEPETPPQFPGGTAALLKYIKSNLKYPKGAMKAGAQGRVILQFTIDECGKVTNVITIRSVHPLLDAEAERAVRAMPDWKPGQINGKNVKTRYFIPVSFKMPTGTIVDPQAYQDWKRYMTAQKDSIDKKRTNKGKSRKKDAEKDDERK